MSRSSQPEFGVLGAIEVRRAGKPVPLEGQRLRALLAFMLARANRDLSTDDLIEAIWRDQPLRDPHNALHACVSRLRAAIGETLESTRSGYRLTVDPGRLDANRFEQLAAEGNAALAADDSRAAASVFAGALELWRGSAYADVAYVGVVDDEIQRLEELRMIVVERRLEALLRSGDGSDLVSELNALVCAHPLRERLRSQLAIALYRSGRQADALQACRAARRMLRDEFGLEPTTELRELEMAILHHDSTLDHQPAARPPVPATSIIGREHELEEGLALLRREDVRLLTITGPGGIGKTRLALALAAELGDVGFVDLSNVLEPALVASAIAAAIGLRQWRGQSVAAALEQHLRSRERMLFLDSFEHVVDQAPLLTRLLGAAPGLRLLVTSRTVLRVSAEHELRLGPLDEEGAVDLFRARARAVDSRYEVNEGEASSVRDICRRLDRLPLAIELAAARTNVLSPEILREHLGDGFDELFAGRRDAPARHQTLQAAMDWSWALLDEDERLAFRRLAVFVGGFTVEAAEAVLEERAALAQVASLADKSLVRREAGNRFRLLDTVREYALRRLDEDPPEREETQRRHARYYVDLVQSADSSLYGANQREAVEQLELEHGNIGAAFAFAIAASDRGLALSLTLASHRFWFLHGHFAEGLAALESTLELAPQAEPAVRATLCNAAGMLAAEQGEYEVARRWWERCAGIARRHGDAGLLGCALANQGRLAWFEGDLDRARRFYEQSLETNPGDDRAVAVSRGNLALVAAAEQELDRALELANETLAIAERVESPRLLANARLTLGRVLLACGEPERASTVLAPALESKLKSDDRADFAECLDVIGELCVSRGQGREAATVFGAAAAVRASFGLLQSPELHAGYVRYSAMAREQAGAKAFDRAYAKGAALPVSEAMALGLAAVSSEARAVAGSAR